MLDYLYQALHSKYGIAITLSDISLGRAQCYKARADSGDPELSCLQFRPDPAAPDSVLWIIKGKKQDDGPQV